MTAKDVAHSILVAMAIASAHLLAATKGIDGPAYWKTVTLSLAMLILGSGITGLVGIWTAAKVAQIETMIRSRAG